MRGLSQELVIALIFGAFWLMQFLYRLLQQQRRRKAASMQEENQAEELPVAVATTVALDADTPRHVAARLVATPTRVAPRPLPRARRYSRAALMPDRRALRDAIVITAILQPCHANRDHLDEQMQMRDWRCT